MQVTLNRQLLGLEDLEFGVGTVVQTRGGQDVTITKINAANLPFDGSQTLQQVYDDLAFLINDLDLQNGLYLVGSDAVLVSGIKAVAGDAALITAVKNIDADATLKTSIKTVGADAALITGVKSIDADTTLKTSIKSIDADLTLKTSLNTVADAGNLADIKTVASASNLADIVTIADDLNSLDLNGIADVTTVANDLVLGVDSKINIVSGNITPITTVATEIAKVTNYADTYSSSATAPVAPTLGDLWFDETNNIMKVYTAGGWANAGSSINGTSNRYDYVAGTASGAYDGVSLTTFPATYDSGYIDVYVEGIKLVPTTDFTATDGNTVVLASALTAGQDVSIVGYGTFELLNEDVIGFNTSYIATGSEVQGSVYWNSDEETLDLVQNGNIAQLGQETQVHCRNNTGVQINKGTVVMATGTVGASGRITIGAYDNTSQVKYVLGITAEDIADGTDGKVTAFGKVRGIDTSTWAEGAVLYTAASGGLTSTEPTTGIKLPVAFVITQHATNGTIMCRLTPHDELESVPRVASTDNAIARYDGTTGKLQNSGVTIDDSGNLGVGTTSPAYKLDVRGEAGIELYNGTGGGDVLNLRPSLGDASKYNMSISSYDHSGGGVGPADGISINGYDGVSIATGSSTVRQERMRIDASGNVGIGTSSPSANLEVLKGSIGTYALLSGDDADGARGLAFTSSTTVSVGDTHTIQAKSATGEIAFKTATTEKMRIDSAGNVGIGTSSPQATLHSYQGDAGAVTPPSTADGLVIESNGDSGMCIFAPDANNSNIYFGSPATNTGGIVRWNATNNELTLGTNKTGADLVFRAGGFSEKARILSSGGITFNGDTATANALDDYEEGTWTPTIEGSTTNPTQSYQSQFGKYTKIGRMVYADFYIYMATTGITSGTGAARVGGLPFPISSTAAHGHSAVISYAANWGLTQGRPIAAYALSGNTKAQFRAGDGSSISASTASCDASDITNSTLVAGTLIYCVD